MPDQVLVFIARPVSLTFLMPLHRQSKCLIIMSPYSGSRAKIKSRKSRSKREMKMLPLNSRAIACRHHYLIDKFSSSRSNNCLVGEWPGPPGPNSPIYSASAYGYAFGLAWVPSVDKPSNHQSSYGLKGTAALNNKRNYKKKTREILVGSTTLYRYIFHFDSSFVGYPAFHVPVIIGIFKEHFALLLSLFYVLANISGNSCLNLLSIVSRVLSSKQNGPTGAFSYFRWIGIEHPLWQPFLFVSLFNSVFLLEAIKNIRRQQRLFHTFDFLARPP